MWTLRGSNRCALGPVGLMVILFSCSGACARHMLLTAPRVERASSYRCVASGCTPSEEDDPAFTNRGGTQRIVLPAECAGRYAQIYIEDVRGAEPVVWVHCATPEARVGEMKDASDE